MAGGLVCNAARKLMLSCLAGLVVGGGLPVLSSEAGAANAPPTEVYNDHVQGDFTVAGNTLNTCCGFNPQDGDAAGGVGAPSNNSLTVSSSRSSFSMPAGATVVRALVYLFRDAVAATAPTEILLAPAGDDYAPVTLTEVGDDAGRWLYRADVTAAVAAGGAGEVWVGMPTTYATPSGIHAWAMFIVYSEPSLPWHQVVIVDQAAGISGGGTLNATASNVAVVPGGASDATVANFTFYSSPANPDTMRVCAGSAVCPHEPANFANTSIYAQNALNPVADIANSSFTLDGAAMPGEYPTPQQIWTDLDLFRLSAAIPDGATSATVTQRSVSDTLFSGVIALSTSVYAPVPVLTDTVSAPVPVGGYLDYELTYDLDPVDDDSEHVVVVETLPGNVTYVPESTSVSAGANPGVKTDAPGDDQVDVSGSTITWRVGTGANAADGGNVAVSDGPQTLRFRVQVTSGSVGDPIVDSMAATISGAHTPLARYTYYTNSVSTILALPPAPAPLPLTSTGVGTTPQSANATVPPGNTVTLLDGSTSVSSLTIPGQGTYTIDPITGVITFTPVPGFSGTPTPVIYQVTDEYGQTGSSTYTPTVTPPPPPTASEKTSSGPPNSPQTTTIPIPAGGTVTLLDGSTPVSTLTIPGQGTYVLDPTTGVITFTPAEGYSGTPTPVTYRVTDAYGQSVVATYSPQVLAVPTTPPPSPPVAELPQTGREPNTSLRLGIPMILVGLGLTMLTRRPKRRTV
jgi:CshA-type fibril repeat protein